MMFLCGIDGRGESGTPSRSGSSRPEDGKAAQAHRSVPSLETQDGRALVLIPKREACSPCGHIDTVVVDSLKGPPS